MILYRSRLTVGGAVPLGSGAHGQIKWRYRRSQDSGADAAVDPWTWVLPLYAVPRLNGSGARSRASESEHAH